jgi:MinD-like ATPase involved in chromosome partitioning or flagellar assembly
VATPRLPAYEDEPVMPGARLPAPGRARAQRRGDVISVCSYKGGSGKCLTGDSLIVDPVTGVPRRLDDLVGDPEADTVLTLDGVWVRAVGIDAKIDSGVKPTVRVEFESGRSVTVTPHHPFLLADGWRQAQEIEPGEEAALAARIPFPTEPLELTLLQLAQLATALSEQDDRRYGVGPDVEPDTAYRLSEDQLGQVIGLLWASDGAVSDDGTPSLELAEERTIRTVQHLLLRFGVQSRLGAGQDERWRLEIPEGDRVTFAKRVPLCSGQFGQLAPAIATDQPPGHDGDIAWDRVTAITPAGEQQVWDLTVGATHCFVANDIVVHNTTTAVLAAAVLARAVQPGGKRVALVDANTAQSSVATVLQRPGRGSIVDLVRTDVDEDMLAHALTPIPEAGDLDVLFGAPDLRCADERLLTPTLWRRVVAALRRTHDYVIVDTPVAEAVGFELFDDFVLRDSSLLLVVLDPNRETIHNNVEWLDIIGDPVSAGGRNFPPDRVAIVLNRADPQLVWNEVSVGDHFRRFQFLGAIPHSMAVQQAADDARLTQRFDATVDQAVRHMLGALLHEPLLDSDAPAGATGSVLDRLLERLFGRRAARSECSPV